MAKKKNDPTLPFTEITIDGVTYKMCFVFDALAQAEDALIAAGHDANLMFRCPPFTFASIRILFAASLLAYQPDTDFETAKSLITFRNKGVVLSAVMKAWNLNMPAPDTDVPKGPPEPANQ